MCVVRAMCCLLVTMDTIPNHHVISILMCGIFAFFFFSLISLFEYTYLLLCTIMCIYSIPSIPLAPSSTENKTYCWTVMRMLLHIKWNDKSTSLHIHSTPNCFFLFFFFVFSHFSISSVYYSGNFIIQIYLNWSLCVVDMKTKTKKKRKKWNVTIWADGSCMWAPRDMIRAKHFHRRYIGWPCIMVLCISIMCRFSPQTLNDGCRAMNEYGYRTVMETRTCTHMYKYSYLHVFSCG